MVVDQNDGGRVGHDGRLKDFTRKHQDGVEGALGNLFTAEQLAAAYIKSEILMPKYLCFEGENLYFLILKERVESRALPRKFKRKKKNNHEGETQHD
jgi:hypothetical protein